MYALLETESDCESDCESDWLSHWVTESVSDCDVTDGEIQNQILFQTDSY